jgi:CDP-glycerol glycerophosphotransferase
MGLSDAPRVSVIIPVYNTAPWLDECLNSVVNQTLRDIQIICVNDGSTDNSPDILRNHAAADPRIVVIDQENQGLSVARNVGLEIATGEYIHFLDSDDVLDAHALEECHRLATADHLDCLAFERNIFQDGGPLPQHLPQTPNMRIDQTLIDAGVMDGATYFSRIASSEFAFLPVWVYHIRKDFLDANELRFLPGVVHEDVHFTSFMLLKAQRIRAVDRAFVYCRKRQGSLTNVTPTRAHLLGRFYAAADLHEFVRERDYPDAVLEQVFLFMRIRAAISWRIAKSLSAEERESAYASDARHRRRYFQEVKPWLEALDENKLEIGELKKQLAALNKRLAKVEDSRSYKVGRVITWPLRKLRTLFARR